MHDRDESPLHQLTVDEIFKHLGTGEGGLSPEEALQRLGRYGPNVLEVPSHYSLIRGFLRQFTHFLALLLWIAAALAFTAEFMKPGEGMATLGWAILGVIIINAGFDFFQEYKAERADEQALRFSRYFGPSTSLNTVARSRSARAPSPTKADPCIVAKVFGRISASRWRVGSVSDVYGI